MTISRVGFSSFPAFISLFLPLKIKEPDGRFNFFGHSVSELDEKKFNQVEQIPFTEDCKRAAAQLISLYGTLKLNEFIIHILSESHSHLPVEFVNAAYSYYMAVVHKKNIDIALLNTLDYTASRPLVDGNGIAELAYKTRGIVAEYLGEAHLQQFMGSQESELSQNFFIGLAIVAVISRFWLSAGAATERRSLQLPTFLASIVLRASSYWNYLEHMAHYARRS
ncbi:hypothetical protein [Vagococcus sp. WN89Y]|uniref:hypothetical protein n=1 Tax=Vagococcus sp. WN89Y TaxID=3457258 RepID=UPI003FCD4633